MPMLCHRFHLLYIYHLFSLAAGTTHWCMFMDGLSLALFEKANATVENRILLLAPACAYSMWTIASHCFIIPGTRTCLLHFSMHALPIAGIIEDFDQRGRCSELNRAMILGRLPSYMNLGIGIFFLLWLRFSSHCHCYH